MKDVETPTPSESVLEEPEGENGKMSFLEHLDELRQRLLRVIIYIGVGFLSCFYFAETIYNFMSQPVLAALPAGKKLVFTGVTDPFRLYMKVAILAGIFLTSPFILYEVWKFISPGLYRKEKKFAIPFLICSVILFLGGGAFAFYVVLPRAYGFLLKWGDSFEPMITVNEYLDLTDTIVLGFGLIFEMPVIVGFLSIFGLVSAKFLWSKFKYAVLLIFIAAAVLSPTPDALTQCIYAGPMVILYLISIGVAYLFGRRRKALGLD
jgi:sec-independent protein translocase protein TatC